MSPLVSGILHVYTPLEKRIVIPLTPVSLVVSAIAPARLVTRYCTEYDMASGSIGTSITPHHLFPTLCHTTRNLEEVDEYLCNFSPYMHEEEGGDRRGPKVLPPSPLPLSQQPGQKVTISFSHIKKASETW